MSNTNPHNLTFPYPQLGTTTRPLGQGCTSCVHRMYCPAVYWFRRYTFKDVEETMGRACLSWTTDIDEQVTSWTDNDLDEEDYMYVQGVGSEAVRCGIGQTTGGSSQSE